MQAENDKNIMLEYKETKATGRRLSKVCVISDCCEPHVSCRFCKLIPKNL